MPVNVKMVFEGMEESGSEGLEAVVRKEAGGFLKDVDAVCISDKYVRWPRARADRAATGSAPRSPV